MRGSDLNALDLNIGRARIGLSLVGLVSIYIDPTTGGLFGIAPQMLAVLACHFAYGVSAYVTLSRHSTPERFPSILTGLDIFFATLLALCTEGPTSPSYAFFTFAIIAAGCRFNFRNYQSGHFVWRSGLLGDDSARWWSCKEPSHNAARVPSYHRISDRFSRSTAGKL